MFWKKRWSKRQVYLQLCHKSLTLLKEGQTIWTVGQTIWTVGQTIWTVGECVLMQAVKHWTYILQVHISIHIYQILLHDNKVKITKLYDCLENLPYIQQYWFISKTRFYQIRAYSWNSTAKPDLKNIYETHIQVRI